MTEMNRTPIASVVQQAFNVAVLRDLFFIPYEPRMIAPITVSYQQWLAAGPLQQRAHGVRMDVAAPAEKESGG